MKKNVLFITSDQQHWDTLGFRNAEVSTPNLDRLAAAGTTFSNAFTVNPTCTPTRSSLLTGTYPSQHGAYTLGTKLLEDRSVIGDIYQQNNFRTALVGKAHFQPLLSTEEYPSLEAYPILQDLDYWRKFNGPFYGFEEVELARNHADEAHVGQHYAIWLEDEKGLHNWRDYFLKPTGNLTASEHEWKIPEECHYGYWIAEKTIEKLTRYKQNDENFYLWASFFDPHPPYTVPEPWKSMYNPEDLTLPEIVPGEHDNSPYHIQLTQTENPDFSFLRDPENPGTVHGAGSHLHNKDAMAKNIAIYYAMISLMDKQIGMILDKLDELGLTEDTLIVFTSDHGHYYGHHGLAAKGPFHYDDGIKVPFIASLPGKIPEGKISENLQSLVDMVPTFLSASGIKPPIYMTGKNMLPEWTEESAPIRDHIICENHHEPYHVHMKSYVNKEYKMTVYYNQEYGELYDRINDPKELNNLWDNPKYQHIKGQLFQKFLYAEMGKEQLAMPRVTHA